MTDSARQRVSHGSPRVLQKYPGQDLLPARRSALNEDWYHTPEAKILRTLYEKRIHLLQQRGEKVPNSYGVIIQFPKKVDF